jgi:hypothetical protein
LDTLLNTGKKHLDFLIRLCNWLPRTGIENFKTEKLQDNIYRISLTVINRGYLPSTTQIGKINKWCPKIRLALNLNENQRLAGGRILQFIDHLAGSGGSQEFSWVVLGKSGETVKLTVGSPMTGIIHKDVELR